MSPTSCQTAPPRACGFCLSNFLSHYCKTMCLISEDRNYGTPISFLQLITPKNTLNPHFF